NRRNLEKLLGPAVQSITVSPASVHAIAEGPVDHAFVKALKEVDETGRYIEANEKGQGPGKIKAIEDVKPLLEDLKTKAIMRIRDHIVAQIKSIRAPNVNAQIIQQRQLLRYKEIFGFLHRNHAQLAGELTQAYVNTMKWYYTSHFTRYVQALEKIKIQTVDRNDLMGSDPMASQRTAYQGTRLPGHDPFILGRRLDILKTHSSMAISSQLAEDDKSTHGIEVPFRHFTLALIDNVSAEYAFTTDFFSPSITYPILSRHVSTIFAPTFSLGQSLTRTLIEHSTDCLGILLCVRLAQHFAFELQRRRCPVADGYINAVNMILWPRFQIVMDMHCESLRKFTAGVSTTAAPVLAVSSATSAAPHYFTQRYGTFLEGLLALSSEAGDDEPVSNSLARLSAEFDALLVKLARASGEPKRRERFLVNNYSLILTIISDTQGKLAVEQKEHLTQKMKEAGGKKCADFTHAVIGGGVVGLAVARQLAGREGTSTLLLEANGAVGMETSSRNSEVIHAGLYYPRDSLKTRLCIEGRHLLYSLCARHQIPHARLTKWILAQDESQLQTVASMHAKARSLGIPTRWIAHSQAAAQEPDVRARAGILESPTTGIVDSHALMLYLLGDFEERGGTTALMSRVTRIEAQGRDARGGYRIYTNGSTEPGISFFP
ncbi:hypothetical protein KEM55_003324, partial [Ascosphaera atra]